MALRTRITWPPHRWSVVAVLLLSGSGLVACSRAPVPPAAGANLLLVTLDTTRADRLGAYGSAAGLTPNLDALADRGVVFEQAIAQAAVTPVSHASILTGLDPYSHGLRVLHGTAHNRLGEAHVTLAEALAEAGYDTAAFVSAFPAGSYFGLDQGFSHFDEDFAADNPVTPNGLVSTGLNQRRADHTTDRALAWLETASAPYFLWVHYFDPHDPRVLPPDDFLAARREPAGGEREQLRQMYDHEVAFLDRELGRLLDGIAAEPAPTVVAVVADHGEGLGDHDWWTHGVLYQEQIQVPLILVGPGLPAANRVSARVRTTDLVPSLLELLGVEQAGAVPLDGVSVMPLLDGAAQPRRVAYADSLTTITYRFTPSLTDRKDDMLFSMLEGRWKYIHHQRRPAESELYDLERDPGESRNLLVDEPAVAEAMRRSLELRPLLPGAAPARDANAEDEEARRRLRALGYVD
jgi:arylsulfatase A-like enzyme